MKKFIHSGLWLALAVVLLTASCGGGTQVTPGPGPNPGFTRLVAVVTDADGAPLRNLNVRVEGRDTGILTDNTGQFALTAASFPNGVNAVNELAFGKDGIVIGTHSMVPAQNSNVTIRFAGNVGPGGGSGSASISGTAYASAWYGPNPLADGQATDVALPPGPQPLDGVQVTLFSADKNEVFQTTTAGGGHYSFEGLEAGTWQMAALIDNYYPEMAAVSVEDGAAVTYDFTMTPKGVVPPGSGFKVSGVLKDSQSGAPIAGATVSLYADTGYCGLYYPATPSNGGDVAVPPVPPTDPSAGIGYASAPDANGTVSTEPGQSEPGYPGDPATGMPYYRYDPQYQTTTTAADGSFSFPDEVAGYTLWLSYSADGYLAGNTYQDISTQKDDLSLSLTMDPLVPASISGHVVDGNGQPVVGAEVDFVFASGGFGGGIAVPGFAGVDDIAADGKANYDNSGNGTTGPMPGMEAPSAPPNGGGYGPNGDTAAPAPPEASGSAGQGSNSGNNSEDNMLMQRFLWEQKQKGSSAVSADFSGFASAITDANGDYHIADIPAGHYYVMANAYKHLGYGGEADLTADPATNTLDVTLPAIPVGSVEGTITDADGHPVPDALVNATQPFVDPFSFTDASGHYRIDNVPAGEWTISAFKSGFITSTTQTTITENGVAHISLTLNAYTGQNHNTTVFTGSVTNSQDNTGIAGADIVFTPVKDELGGYYASVKSGSSGAYSATLVPDQEYSLLVQKDGFQDLNMRIWTDVNNPQLNFWLWPATAGGGGGWGPPQPGPMPMPGTTEPSKPDQGPPSA
jgi:protocatechuate 3,4-dioxygenase beta subunit